MSKVFGIVGSVVVAVCLMMGSMNFARLQARVDAPSVGEMAGYVGVPALVALGVLVALAFHFVPMIPTSTPAPQKFVVSTTDEAPTNVPDPNTDLPAPVDHDSNRGRIWAIIDELSDALRDDDAGSEALFVVRERYHRIQFQPSGAVDEGSPGPAPKSSSKPSAV